MNYAKITKKNIDAPTTKPHPWAEEARVERLAVAALDQLWRPNTKGGWMTLFQLQGSMSANKALRDYAGKSPSKVEAFIRARPHLYLTKVVVVRGVTSIHVYRRSEEFRRGLKLVISYIQSKGAATMTEIRKLLNDRGYGGIISQLWHDCTPSVLACVRCATPFTADMGAIFEWANYENRLVATKVGLVDDVVLINWTERFVAAKLLPNTAPRTKSGDAVVTQLCKDQGRLRPRSVGVEMGIEFGLDSCGLPSDSDLRDYFRIGQRNVFFEARLILGFQLFQEHYVFSRYWRAVWIRKETNGSFSRPLSRIRKQSNDDWIKLVESELEFIDEDAGGDCSPVSVVSGNGYWHDDE